MIERKSLRQILFDVVREFPVSYVRKLRLREDYDDVVLSIYAYTQALPENIKLKTRIYWVLNSLCVAPRCLNERCGREMLDKDVRNVVDGYPLHCCPQCAKESEHRKKTYESSCSAKYGQGVTNASQSEQVKRLKEITTSLHYGVLNPMKSSEIKHAVAGTNMAKYGAVCPLQNAEIHEKSNHTCMERYGEASFSKTCEFREKTIASNKAKFGVDYPNQDPAIRRLARKRYSFEGISFDSAPELAFYIYCRDCGIDVVYQPKVLFEYRVGDKTFKYQPDFMTSGRYVEIKGCHFFENRDPSSGRMINPYDRSQDDIYQAKYECMIQNNVEILVSDRYRKYLDYMKSVYGKSWKDKYRSKTDNQIILSN